MRGAGWVRRVAVGAVIVVAALLGCAAPAAAHSELVSSTPEPDSVVAEATTTVELGFSERLLPDLGGASVVGPGGKDAVAGKLVADGGVLRVPLRPLRRAGDYTVRYRVVAEDGHAVEGSFSFRLTRAAARAGSTTTAPPPPTALGDGRGPGDGPPADSLPPLPIPRWTIAAVALLGMAWVLRVASRRRDSDGPTAEVAT